MQNAPKNDSHNENRFDPPQPNGDDPRTAPKTQGLYFRLRDLRSNVRTKERQQAQSVEAIEEKRLTVLPEWRAVASLAEDLLENHANDVEVLVWLTEAKTRLNGFAGTAECFHLIDRLVETYGTSLHSIPDAEGAERFEPIGSLNGHGRDGTLMQPLRLLPLTPDADYGECALWHLQQPVSKEKTASRITATDISSARTRLAEIQDCLSAMQSLNARFIAMFGADAPPMDRLIDTVDDANRAVSDLIGTSEETPSTPTQATEVTESSTSPRPIVAADVITNREDAFKQMLAIAKFFRQSEPHSPIAPALETLVRRGKLDFVSLMTELIPDENNRKSFMTTAGIGPEDTP